MATLTTPGKLIQPANPVQWAVFSPAQLGSLGQAAPMLRIDGYTLRYGDRIMVLDPSQQLVARPSGDTTYTLPFVAANGVNAPVPLHDGALDFYDLNGALAGIAVL